MLSCMSSETRSSGQDIALINGTIIGPSGRVRADILISDGRIKRIERALDAHDALIINAEGRYILPAAIDEHIHSREPGLTYKDDFTNATRAAAAGGVGTVVDMPNTIPPVDNASKLIDKMNLLSPKAYVDFGLYGNLNNSNVDEFEPMVKAGAMGFKVFMSQSTGNLPQPDEAHIYQIMERSAATGALITFHAEEGSLVEMFTERARGLTDPSAHMQARPSVCESMAIAKVCAIVSAAGGRAHIMHVSSAAGMRVLKAARALGINVGAEVTPHHLFLSSEDYPTLGNVMKVNPPIRTRADQDELWRGLLDGTISTVGSDHAPHTPKDKEGGIWEAASGFIGVQTTLPLLLDSALSGRISIELITRVAAENPARLLGLYPRKGCVEVGSDADLVIFDPRGETEIRPEMLLSRYPISPFIGRKLRGRLEMTMVRGMIVFRNGIINGPPAGKFLVGPGLG